MALGLYLNDDIPIAAEALLREQGFSVTHSTGEGNRGKHDGIQLDAAISQDYALVTFNAAHFRQVHRTWSTLQACRLIDRRHKGILAFTQPVPVADLVRALEHLPVIHLTSRMLVWVVEEGAWREVD